MTKIDWDANPAKTEAVLQALAGVGQTAASVLLGNRINEMLTDEDFGVAVTALAAVLVYTVTRRAPVEARESEVRAAIIRAIPAMLKRMFEKSDEMEEAE